MRRAGLDFCTIVSKNYLSYARAWSESLRAHHPQSRLFVLLADRVSGYFDPAAEPFQVITIEELPIPDLPRFCFQYTLIELNTASKPYFLTHLFAAREAEKLVYLDPDVLVTHPLTPLEDLLDRSSIILTPHLTEPYQDDALPCEPDILRAGTYNLGFIALRRGDTTEKMLRWWQERLYCGGYMAPEQGFHVDQKWMDLVPGFYADVHILRDPGYNVAYWNLGSRPLLWRDDRPFVGDSPCYFFHFSGYDLASPENVSKFQSRLTMDAIGEARRAFTLFRERLLSSGHALTAAWPYAFSTFDNGVPIPASLRRNYLRLGDAVRQFGDPFETGPASSFFQHWMDGAQRSSLEQLREKSDSEEGFLDYVYFLMFWREADAEGKAWFLERLNREGLTRRRIFYELYASPEFQESRVADGRPLRSLDPAEFTRFAYRRFLSREPRPEEMVAQDRRQSETGFSRQALVEEILASDEFARVQPIRPEG